MRTFLLIIIVKLACLSTVQVATHAKLDMIIAALAKVSLQNGGKPKP